MDKLKFLESTKRSRNIIDDFVDDVIKKFNEEVKKLPKLEYPYVYMPTYSKTVEDENGNMKIVFEVEIKDMTPISFED